MISDPEKVSSNPPLFMSQAAGRAVAQVGELWDINRMKKHEQAPLDYFSIQILQLFVFFVSSNLDLLELRHLVNVLDMSVCW